MNQILSQYTLRLLSLLCLTFVLFSCINEGEPMPEVQEEEHTAQMLFSVAPPVYADSEDASEVKTTRAATADWPDGARLYLRFGDKGATGTATYDAGTKQWTLSFNGLFNTDADDRCEVWYFENPVSADATSASFSPTTAIFYADSATYYYHNEIVHLRAVLKPTEARLRYKGIPGTVLRVVDWPRYGKFTSSLAMFAEANGSPFTITVGSDGYTPYIYGHSDVDMLYVEIESTPFYYLLSQTDILTGRSYSTAMPTESLVSDGKWSHSASCDRTFTVTGNGKTVTFKMIYIQGGTFDMGASDMDLASPVHSVTISKKYYMCETEVTQALWYAVMGSNPSHMNKADDFPVETVSYYDCQSFLSALNSNLSSQLGSGEQFRFPTEAEWEFAARGGNKSNGYTYSGSNIIKDVGWYTSNSGYKTHPVKTKAANELGIYDMTGNLGEWCYEGYGLYSDSAQTNPIGPTYSTFRMLRGGSWGSSASLCRVASRNFSAPSERGGDCGLRICLGAPIGQ